VVTPEAAVAPPPPPPPEEPVELTREGPWREFADVVWLSVPIIIGMLSWTVMSLVDSLMLGRHESAELAASGAAATVFFLVVSFLFGTLSLVGTFVGQSAGAGRLRRAPGYVWQGIYVALAWGLMAVALWPLVPTLFRWAGHELRIQAHETLYLRCQLCRIASVGIGIAIAQFYKATKRAVVPMIVSIVANGLNVLGNWVLIFGKFGFPELGIAGAAIATVAASYLGMLMYVAAFLSSRTHRAYGSRRVPLPDFARIWEMLRLALPSGLTIVAEGACWSVFLLKVVGDLGNEALAGTFAAIRVVSFVNIAILAVGMAVQALVSRHIGMNDHRGAKRRTYHGILVAVVLTVAIVAVFALLRHEILWQFCDKNAPDELNEKIVALGSTILLLTAAYKAIGSVGIICRGALRGAGDTRFLMVVCILMSWLVFLPLAWYLAIHRGLGIFGAWSAVAIYISLLSGIALWRFLGDRWQRIDIFRGRSDP